MLWWPGFAIEKIWTVVLEHVYCTVYCVTVNSQMCRVPYPIASHPWLGVSIENA